APRPRRRGRGPALGQPRLRAEDPRLRRDRGQPAPPRRGHTRGARRGGDARRRLIRAAARRPRSPPWAGPTGVEVGAGPRDAPEVACATPAPCQLSPPTATSTPISPGQ